MAKLTPIEFFKQVRSETQKVSWPTRKETMQSTIAVFVMVVVASLFLFADDQVLAWIIKMILNLGD